MENGKNRIGIVSTRLAGTDGVSLETIKWVTILTNLGYECFYFAGESDWPEERTYLVSEAHFNHPDISRLNVELFKDYVRKPGASQLVQQIKDHLKQHLYKFLLKFSPNLLITENALSIPMNIPLGLALTEFIAETNLPVIGHHHDFTWERQRFSVTAADDYLRAAFPPTLRSIRHVVINSFASQQLALRTGASSITLIPNVMDFDRPPLEPDGYADDLRDALGIAPDERLILQPTRIVPRKRIELAIDLIQRLGIKSALVISHNAGDEHGDYEAFLHSYADALGVRVLFAANVIHDQRGRSPDGRKLYSLADVYQQADLVTYPSRVEGFGNAFLETIYYKRPLVMSSYEIFKTDIQPKGFKVIGFDDFITDTTVQRAREVLERPSVAEDMVEHNYEVGRRYYSYHILEDHLVALLNKCLGSD